MKKLMEFALYFVFIIAIFTGIYNALIGGASSTPGVTNLVGAAIDK